MSTIVTVQLSQPISFNGESFSELTFREATAGDARHADEVVGEYSKMLAIMAGMAGVPLGVIDCIPLRELNSIVEKVVPLMGEFPAAAGSTQSA